MGFAGDGGGHGRQCVVKGDVNSQPTGARRPDALQLSGAAEGGDSKTEHLAKLISQRHGGPIQRLLVVGCGSGHEAAILARQLNCSVVGIDVIDEFDPVAATIATLEIGDATGLR